MNGTKVHILLVDDDPGDCRLVKLVLAKSPQATEFTIETAGSLAQALEQMERYSFDLVLLDLSLPDSQGLSTLDNICKIYKDIPVVVLTGLADEDTGLEAIRRGASDYLFKGEYLKHLLVRTIRYSLERKRTEQELKRQEKNLQAIFDVIPVGMLLIGEDTVVVKINDAATKVVGRSSSEMTNLQLGESFNCIHSSDDPRGCGHGPHCPLCPIHSVFEQVLNSAQAVHGLEYQPTLLVGQRKIRPWLEFHAEPLTMEGKRYVVVAISNITERKKTQERIEQLNVLKDDLLQPSSLPDKLTRTTDAVIKIFDADFARIWITNPSDRCDSGCIHAEVTEGPHICKHRDRCLHLMASSGRYTHTNGKVHRRVPFGCYKIGRIAAGQDKKFVTNDVTRDPRVHNNDWATELGLVSFAGYRLLCPEGHPIGVLALFSKHAISADEDAFLEALAATTSQVIHTAKTKESLYEAKKVAEQANRAKSEFLANMSHELRTPLNAILGFSELLAQEELVAEHKEWLDTINASGKSLLALIEDILDFSKMEAGKLDLQIIECSLEDILTAVELLLRPQAVKKGIQFDVQSASDLPAIINTDPGRIHQCLVNLVSNAIKFTDSGSVCLRVSLETHPGNSFIRFDVEDTGIGIAPDKQQLIFDSFSQADASSTRKYGGTGLGLAITKQLTGKMGGEVLLQSELGKGSIFSLLIPAGVDVESAPAMEEDNISAQLQGKDQFKKQRFSGRVLVAEDNSSNQDLIKLLLEKMGLEVSTVEDGRQAVDRATSESFDLIFMDIQMPVMNGYEATRALREKQLRTPIIALTAHAMVGDEQKCLDAGCDGYVSKPIQLEKFYAVIAKYLSPPSALSAQVVKAGVGQNVL